MRVLQDHITDPLARVADAPVLWMILGIVAGVAAISAVLIVILIKKKKKGGKRHAYSAGCGAAAVSRCA